MKEKTVTVTNEFGIHLRPAMIIVEKANEYYSEITLSKLSEKADAKSIMEVTMLKVKKNEKIKVTTEGKYEEEAMNSIVKILSSNLDIEIRQSRDLKI